jgi:hypothetical protein
MPEQDPRVNLGEIYTLSGHGTGLKALDGGGAVYNAHHPRWGIKGDGITNDSAGIQKLFDASIADGVPAYFPAGTYIIDPAVNIVYLNFTQDGQSLRVFGAGRGITVFKERDDATKVSGRYTKMFYLYFNSSVQIDEISFEDVTFDKNGASNGAPPAGAGSFEWEQAHVLQIAGNWGAGITPYIRSFSWVRVAGRDKVAAFLNVAVQMQIGRVVLEDFYEDAWSGLFGERGDLEITCWSKDVTFDKVQARYIQTEPIAGYEAGPGKEKHFRYSNCRIRVLQINEPDSAADYASAMLVNCEMWAEFSTRGISVQMDNCTWRHNLAHWAKRGTFANCTIRLPYNAGAPGTVSPLIVQARAGYPQLWQLSNCEFVLDSLDQTVRPTGRAIGINSSAKMTTKGELVVRADHCTFDPRFEGIVDAYGVGEYHVRNSKLACHGVAFLVGGISTYIGELHLEGNDYRGCVGANLINLYRGNELWELRFNETLRISEAKVTTGSGTGSLEETYRIRPRMITSARPTTLTGQGFLVGDEAINTLPSMASPVTRWRCTYAGAPGTWHAVEWIVAKGASTSRPSLHANDSGVQYLDTTLDADGKPITWTGSAWVDATGAVV